MINLLKTLFKLLIVIVVLVFISDSCKKPDTGQNINTFNQIEDFLDIGKNAPPELHQITGDLKQQLYKRNFIADFIQWHGNPQWNKAIKLQKTNPGCITLAIPAFKNGILTAFFAATITPENKILFEMHRVSTFNNHLKEYSYIGIDTSISKFYLSVFSSNKKEIFLKEPVNNNMPNPCDYCWYEWGVCQQFTNNSDTTTQNMVGYCWNEVCEPDCGPGGPGGGGGGGGGGGCPTCPPPPECPNPYWYSYVPEDPCELPPPPPPPPQDTILNPCLEIEILKNSASFISYLQELKDSSNSNREYGYFLLKNPVNGIFGNTPMGLIEGEANELSLGNFNNPYLIDGIAHSHFDTNTDTTNGLSVYSPEDLWTMCRQFNSGNVINANTFTMSLVTKKGTQYILMIKNLTKFRSWAQQLTLGNFRLFQDLYGGPSIRIRNTNTIAENEKRFLLYLASNEGAGLELFRGNSSFTDWTPIRLDVNNNVITVPCNQF